MIVSINWLKKFTEIDSSIDDFATLIGSRLVEIEEIVDISHKYKDVVVAKIMTCEPLQDSDHLNIAKIDDGSVVAGVERDEQGLVQVVCGAPNVRAGILVAWLPPASTVPSSLKDKEPFVLGSRKLRGVMSNGMLASAKELDLFDDHEGILEIDKDVPAGTKFSEVYELDDQLLDIENKSLTHRPDTFGIVGFAREVAAIQGKKFVTPDTFASEDPAWPEKAGDSALPQVTIDDAELSKRYQAVVLTGVDAKKQSPLEIQTYLSRIGVRPISAAVDVTNYLMMLTGQPLHAFDYDKLKAVNGGMIDIHVRAGRDGEKLQLLDGREIELSSGDIVIANGETAVGLAGAMGGANTEIDEHTTNILLESATFNLYNLRNTQMRHGIFSEAITRFTKGQPAALTAPALSRAVTLFSELTGAVRASDIADAYPGQKQPQPVEVAIATINQALGSEYTLGEVTTTLENVEFRVEQTAGGVKVTPPYWRTDISIPEDIIEEVGRLNGFDSIRPVLPARDFTAVSPSNFDRVRMKLRHRLERAGANEVLSYSFIHGDLLRKAGQDPANSYRLVNSLSPDLQYYRQTLQPSLLNITHPNSKNGFDTFAVFELNKVHQKQAGLNEENVPIEQDHLALVIASKKSKGTAYYQAKMLLEYTLKPFGVILDYAPLPDRETPETAPFESRRSATVSDKKTGTVIGVIGEYKNAVRKAFKLPDYAAGFEIDTHVIASLSKNAPSSYTPLSRYPSTDRDLCFQVAKDLPYKNLYEAVDHVLGASELECTIEPLDIYHEADSGTKNITFRIGVTSHERTLASDDLARLVEAIEAKTADLGAKII